MSGPAISAEAALSFLKETKGALTWSARDFADSLRIPRRAAEQALAFLEAQGYVQRSRSGEFLTTPAGETVSGAKAPRFTRESVEKALAALKERIKQNNKNSGTPYRITRAVAFGDFLLPNRARAQSADAGIALARRDSPRKRDPAKELHSATAAKEEATFLRQLRAKSAHINLRPYAEWMGQRSHRDLLG
jgi:hypothetical protein